MKNKEVEELLNNLYRYKSEDDKYYPEDILTINDVWLLLSYIEQLENNRDKAIEYIEWQKDNPQYDNVWRKYECESLINILKGDSDNE